MTFTLNSKKTHLIKLYLFPLLSGVIYGLAWNLDSLFFLQLFSLVPLLIAFDTIRSSNNKWRKKLGNLFWVSFLFRTPIVSLVLIWMFELSWVALVVLIIAEVILFTATFSIILTKRISDYAIICLLILYELIMQNVAIMVPFHQLGYSWGNYIELIQYYSFLGIEGGSLILFGVNFAFFKWYKSKKLGTFSIVAFSLFIGLTIFSVSKFYLSDEIELDETAKISIIHSQLNSKGETYRKEPLKLTDSVAQVAAPNSLVVLPEVFYNGLGWVVDLSTNKTVKHIESISEANNQTYLIGAYVFSTTKEPTYQSRYMDDYNIYYNNNNASILIGDVVRMKSKKLFIPFFEYIPNNAIAQWINNYISDIGDDRKVTILDRNDRYSYKGKRFNAMLCYESVFPLVVSEYAKENEFLVIHTNEDWNHSDLLSDQYLKVNKTNAIQIGIPVYRVSNFGYSAIINPNGTSEIRTKMDKSLSLLEGNLPLKGRPSFYVKIAGYSYWLGGILLIYFVFRGINNFLKQPKKRGAN